MPTAPPSHASGRVRRWREELSLRRCGIVRKAGAGENGQMKTLRALLLSMVFLTLAGCAGGMLQGQMYRLDTGAQWPFGIQTSYGTGKLTATDPQSGEVFSGQYTGVYHGGGRSFGTAFNAQLLTTTTVQTFTPPSNATARGILRGNRGTVIQIYLDIRPSR